MQHGSVVMELERADVSRLQVIGWRAPEPFRAKAADGRTDLYAIMPNRAHGFGNDPYFVRRRWDYFVKHLLGVDPPAGYKVGESQAR